MPNELREFVYLDTMSVNSLLASQYVAVPDRVRDVSEDIEGEDRSRGISFNLGYGPARISADAQSGENEQVRSMSETERRINEQYRFSILHRVLEHEDMIVDLDERDDDDTAPSFSAGEVVKISGRCYTDPFYRILSAIGLLLRIFNLEEVSDDLDGSEELTDSSGNSVFETFKDVLHGERIGLKLSSSEFNRPVVMSIDTDDLWVKPEREFLGVHNYTVVGRVDKVMPGSEKWDFIDLLQIMGTVFSDEDVERFRDTLADVIEDMSELGGDDDEEENFSLSMDENDYVVDESAIVISPVAIYW